jgi:predicted transcriptional regulator
MQSLTIQLNDEIHQRLMERAAAHQKTLEQFAAECLATTISLQLPTSEVATQMATKFVASWGMRFLHLGRPIFDSKHSIWRIQLFVPVMSEPAQEVGTLQIDAQTGKILTHYEEVKATFNEIRSKLGIESFPKEQHARLSELLAQNRAGQLTAQQQQELNELMEKADEQEIDNLKRLPNFTYTRREA